MTKKRSINIPKGLDKTGYIDTNQKVHPNTGSYPRKYSQRSNRSRNNYSNSNAYKQYISNNRRTQNSNQMSSRASSANRPSYQNNNNVYNYNQSNNRNYQGNINSDVWAHDPNTLNSNYNNYNNQYNNNYAQSYTSYQQPDYGNSNNDDLASKKPTQRQSSVPTAVTIIIVLLSIFALSWCLREFVFQAYEIPSGSMEQTIMTGDMVFAEKVSHHFSDPKRGDIVTFDDPEVSGRILIKRVIATGGQVVNIKNNKLYVDNVEIDEPYINGAPTRQLSNSKITFPYKVPDDCVWVMGDNRTNSQDSRYYGAIPLSSVVGHALAVYWPLYDAKILTE